MNRKNMLKPKLDAEEKALLKSIEKGEWRTVPNFKQEKKKAEAAAANYRKAKEKRICVRVFEEDLLKLKELALEDGLPYQTLVTSILHKYTTGRLKDIR